MSPPMLSSRALLVVLAAYAALVAYGGPNSFQVAPLRPTGDNFAPGEWVDSDSLSSKQEITVIVMASWCPHCARMIDQLAANQSARRRVDMVVFFEDDDPGSGASGLIKNPGKLAGRDLPYFLAHKAQFGGLWDGFPTILGCTRAGCRRKSPGEIGLR